MEFTKLKKMELPRIIYAGHKALDKLSDTCKSLKLRKNGLIVTGNITQSLAGEKVEQILKESGYSIGKILVGEATLQNLEKVKEKSREIDTNFILGVGGGSKIDLAKKAAYDLDVPFLSIPTAAAHDGISSPMASLRDTNNITSMEAAVPIAIIADTEIIMKAPYKNLIAGAADLIANYSAILDWELGAKLKNEEFSSSAFALSKFSAEEVINYSSKIRPNDEETVWVIVKNLIFSGVAMSIAGSSRPASGSEHMFAHAIEKIAPKSGLHGELVGLGTIIMSYLQGQDWEMIKNTLLKIGAPVTAKDLNLTEEQIILALTTAHTIRNRYTILGDQGISKEAAEKAAKITGVI